MRLIRWIVRCLCPAPVPQPVPVPTPEPVPVPEPVVPVTLGLIEALNVERARVELPSFAEDARLNALATGWAREMAGRNQMTHGDFAGRVSTAYPNTAAAEDIAWGTETVAEVVALWMNSPPHRANILGPFTAAGAGREAAEDGTVYWCADFAAAGR